MLSVGNLNLRVSVYGSCGSRFDYRVVPSHSRLSTSASSVICGTQWSVRHRRECLGNGPALHVSRATRSRVADVASLAIVKTFAVDRYSLTIAFRSPASQWLGPIIRRLSRYLLPVWQENTEPITQPTKRLNTPITT